MKVNKMKKAIQYLGMASLGLLLSMPSYASNNEGDLDDQNRSGQKCKQKMDYSTKESKKQKIYTLSLEEQKLHNELCKTSANITLYEFGAGIKSPSSFIEENFSNIERLVRRAPDTFNLNKNNQQLPNEGINILEQIVSVLINSQRYLEPQAPSSPQLSKNRIQNSACIFFENTVEFYEACYKIHKVFFSRPEISFQKFSKVELLKSALVFDDYSLSAANLEAGVTNYLRTARIYEMLGNINKNTDKVPYFSDAAYFYQLALECRRNDADLDDDIDTDIKFELSTLLKVKNCYNKALSNTLDTSAREDLYKKIKNIKQTIMAIQTDCESTESGDND